jgi:hypothetical protein
MFFALVVSSCKEETIGLQPKDNVPPEPVSDVTYKATPGGAVFRYTLPTDEDLLYVKAVYSRKDGVFSEAKATIYTDSLVINGFGDTQPKEVTLIAVDRSDNESTPVKQSVTPLEPPIFHIGESLDMQPFFGGLNVNWENPEREEISVVVMIKDHNEEYVPVETWYSSKTAGEGNLMDMDTVTVDCAVFAQDRWENKTAVKYYTLLPLYDEKLDRLLFKSVPLPGDIAGLASWPISRMFDGIIGDQGYSSLAGSGIWPQSFAFDLGITAKVSKFHIVPRVINTVPFALGHPSSFDILGCAEIDMSGSYDSWTLLVADCKFIKPSGLPFPEFTNEDVVAEEAGGIFFNTKFEMPVRYIRLKVYGNTGGGDNYQLSEVEVYGDPR